MLSIRFIEYNSSLYQNDPHSVVQTILNDESIDLPILYFVYKKNHLIQ